jgi:hypothetical protein
VVCMLSNSPTNSRTMRKMRGGRIMAEPEARITIIPPAPCGGMGIRRWYNGS